MRFPYRAFGKPAGYWPRFSYPSQEFAHPGQPYATFAGLPAIARFEFLSGTLADYNGNGFYFDYPSQEVGQARLEFYTGAAPAPPIIGIHLTVATAVGCATSFHDFMATLSWPSSMGYGLRTFGAQYCDVNWRPQAAPSTRVLITQPVPGVEGNFEIETDSELDGALKINDVTAFGSAIPTFYNGVSLTTPLLWGKLRALGATSYPTPQVIENVG